MKHTNYNSGFLKISTGILKENVYLVRIPANYLFFFVKVFSSFFFTWDFAELGYESECLGMLMCIRQKFYYTKVNALKNCRVLTKVSLHHKYCLHKQFALAYLIILFQTLFCIWKKETCFRILFCEISKKIPLLLSTKCLKCCQTITLSD